jgi:hypothetical protein
MATKLGVFNSALLELGHVNVVDTGEPVEAARSLVHAYDRVVGECLAAGSWNWATETIKAVADTGVTPEFGFPEVFAKPSDFVRTIAVSDDENFAYPLTQYYDDVSYWSADMSPIYVRYVSDDTGMGMDLNKWTPLFERYVSLELAARVCNRLTQSESLRETIRKDRDKAKRAALNQDAMDEPQPKFPPPGRWNMARGGGGGGERGSRGSLTG